MGINEVIKYISIGLAVSIISSVSSAITVDASLTTTPVGTYTYNSVLDHKEEIVYEQSGADVTFTMVKGKGNQAKKILANTVPGKNANGYSKLVLKKIDEKNILIEVDKKDFNNNREIPLTYKARAVFTKGNWTDFLAEKPVQIALTAESKKFTQSPVRTYMSKVIKAIGDKMNPFGDFRGIEIAPSEFKFDIPSINGTKKQLTQVFKIDTRFKLY